MIGRKTTWRNKATETAIMKKVNRKRNPVTSYTQLAQELGAPVYQNKSKSGGPAPSSSFRDHVSSKVGPLSF